MIQPNEVHASDERLARRVLSVARSIASCLDSLTGQPRMDALAILSGVAVEVERMSGNARNVRSQGVNGASVSYQAVQSAFSQDDRDALRFLCGTAAPKRATGVPQSRFPVGGVVPSLWPEQYK